MTDARRIVVTGGASGLGAAIVDRVRSQGGTAIALDVSTDGASDSVTADVRDYAAVETALDEAAQKMGGIDAVVTAAGVDRPGRLDGVSIEDERSVVDVNLVGTMNAARAALPHLRESGGRLVTVASSLGLRPLPDAAAYCASKFGVIGFTRALAAELQGEVGVTTLIPGGMRTHFFDDRDEQYKPPSDANLNDPLQVANTVMFVLDQPRPCEIRELVVCHSQEPSWP